MTVKQLIKELEKMPEDAIVYYDNDYDEMEDIWLVELHKWSNWEKDFYKVKLN